MGHTDYYYVEILSVKFTEFDLISFDFGEALCFVPVSEELKWNRQYWESTDFVRASNHSSKRAARVRSPKSPLFKIKKSKNPRKGTREQRTAGVRWKDTKKGSHFTSHCVFHLGDVLSLSITQHRLNQSNLLAVCYILGKRQEVLEKKRTAEKKNLSD